MFRHSARRAAALNQHWNAVVNGADPSLQAVDPDLVETIRHVQALGQRAHPDPAFVARLEEALMLQPTASSVNVGRQGQTRLPASARWGQSERFRPRRGLPATIAATVAVALVLMTVGLLANRGVLPGNEAERPRIAAPTLATAERDPAGNTTVLVTVVAGMRVEEIAEAYAAESGVEGGYEAFMAAVDAVDVSEFPFLRDHPDGVALEGYFFPDRYAFVTDDPAYNIRLLLNNFDQQFTSEMRARAEAMNLSIRDVITFASLVERETRVPDERPIIAEVYLSRYQQGWRLDADPTVQYVIGVRGDWWPQLSGDDLFIDSPYNTYQTDGLPPGPIANPGFASIQAVLFPAETGYRYFIPKAETGEHIFARTQSEHQANIERWLWLNDNATPLPPEEVCDVAPRTEPILAGSGTPTSLSGTPITSTIGFPHEVTPNPITGEFTVAEERLPPGEPATAAAISGIRDTIEEAAVCADDTDRLFALFSDDYFRRPATITCPESEGFGCAKVPPLPTTMISARETSMRDTRLLADGRVGTIIEGSPSPHFVVFANRNGRWLIDEWIRIAEPLTLDGAGATPTQDVTRLPFGSGDPTPTPPSRGS